MFCGLFANLRIELGENVTSIGKNAFIGCVALKKITVRTINLSNGSVKAGAFKDTSPKAVFTCPAEKKKAYKKLFVKKGASKKAKFK